LKEYYGFKRDERVILLHNGFTIVIRDTTTHAHE